MNLPFSDKPNAPMRRQKPRFLALIGWSWFGFGLLGLLFGVLSIPSFFTLDQIRGMIMQTPMAHLPTMIAPLLQLVDAVIPLTIFQIVYSAIAIWAGLLFVEGRNWARLTLSALNTLCIMLMVWSFHWLLAFFDRMKEATGMEELVEAGLIQNVPLIVTSVIWVSGILLVAPLIWMAWYFHSPKVKVYCIDSY